MLKVRADGCSIFSGQAQKEIYFVSLSDLFKPWTVWMRPFLLGGSWVLLRLPRQMIDLSWKHFRRHTEVMFNQIAGHPMARQEKLAIIGYTTGTRNPGKCIYNSCCGQSQAIVSLVSSVRGLKHGTYLASFDHSISTVQGEVMKMEK